MAGMRILNPYWLYNTIRIVSYWPSSVKPCREEAGGARVRLRTSAAHRSGLAITFRQRLRRTAAAVRNRIRGRVLDGGITDVPGRSSDAVPRALDLGGQTQALPQSGGKSGDAIAHSICYRLSLRMIPSNTARRV